MSNRARIQALGSLMLVPFLLLIPMMWYSLQFSGGQLGRTLMYLLFGVTGAALLLESGKKQSTNSWPFALAAAYSGYFCFESLKDAYHNFHGFRLGGLAQVSSELLGAWVFFFCFTFLLSLTGKKRDLQKSQPIPASSTAWFLGIVATLTGLNEVMNLHTDGFFGTIAAALFAFTVTALGVSLVRGKNSQFACFGLGAVMGSYTLWTLLAHSSLRAFASATGMTLAMWGLFGAAAYVMVVATGVLGLEVGAQQTKK